MAIIGKYAIADLEALTGIRAGTLRIWEKRYQLITPSRSATNIRFYNNHHLKHLLNVNVLNKSGYKISHIAAMSASEIADKVMALSKVGLQTDLVADNFLISMTDLNEELFNQAFASAVASIGFEKTITDVVFPFFKRIGVMWQTGAINPAQEHFLSNLVRQKIISAIDGLAPKNEISGKRILLFLPGDEMHELGLLFLNFLLKNSGYVTIYIGQALPLADLPNIIAISRPDILVCSSSKMFKKKEGFELIDSLKTAAQGRNVYISNKRLIDLDLSLPQNLKLFSNLKYLYSIF